MRPWPYRREPLWPEARVPAEEVRCWISEALPGRPRVDGPVRVFAAAPWGVTARFDTGSRAAQGRASAVVFKASFVARGISSPEISDMLSRVGCVHVPEVLAKAAGTDRAWPVARCW